MAVIPSATYEEDWAGWADFLGKSYAGRGDPKPARRPRPFTQARAFAHKLHFRHPIQWHAYIRRKACPPDLRINPRLAYPKEFRGWKDFLGNPERGTARGSTVWPFERARQFVHKLQLSSIVQYDRYVRNTLNHHLPLLPQTAYPDLWRGWKDFLGTRSLKWLARGAL